MISKFKVGDFIKWKRPYENSMYEIISINKDRTYSLIILNAVQTYGNICTPPWEGTDAIKRIDENCIKLTKLEKALK